MIAILQHKRILRADLTDDNTHIVLMLEDGSIIRIAADEGALTVEIIEPAYYDRPRY